MLGLEQRKSRRLLTDNARCGAVTRLIRLLGVSFLANSRFEVRECELELFTLKIDETSRKFYKIMNKIHHSSSTSNKIVLGYRHLLPLLILSSQMLQKGIRLYVQHTTLPTNGTIPNYESFPPGDPQA